MNYEIIWLNELGHKKTYKEDKEFIRRFYYWLNNKGYKVVKIKCV